MKKSNLNFAETTGKLTRTDYYEKVSQIRTINTPHGVITSKDGELIFSNTANPQNDNFIRIQSLNEYADQDFENFDTLDTKFRTEPERFFSSAVSEGQVRILNKKAIKDMVFNNEQRDLKFLDFDFSKTCKPIK
jgi:hypothetical protein